MLTGVYQSIRKNGTIYYRSNLTYREKHISLGSFATEKEAHKAYLEGTKLLCDRSIQLANYLHHIKLLSYEKAITLLNFRDNGMYIKNPIYLKQSFFLYYLSPQTDYKFDIDDLFFYSSHKIIQRSGRLFVNEYGMQTGILSRYGIKSYAVSGIDYIFVNNDVTDYRYSNLLVINHYRGVTQLQKNGTPRYKAFIHIVGNYTIGTYDNEETAAIAYNKAVDLAKAAGINKNFQSNYLQELSAKEYANIYTNVKISRKYLHYLKDVSCSTMA